MAPDTEQFAWAADQWADGNLAESARSAASDVDAAIALADGLDDRAFRPGKDPWRTLSALATLGAVDLTVARTLEPHLDAVAILVQAGRPDLSALGIIERPVWGVYAAGGPQDTVRARLDDAAGNVDDGTVRLTGTKPWCSLGDRLPRALISVPGEDGPPQLYAVALDDRTRRAVGPRWHARGLVDVTTVALELDAAVAVPVGPPGWYTDRPGFWWGAIEVAAVWFGAAAAVAQALWTAARRRPPDQVAAVAIGRLDHRLHATLLSLRDAARVIDAEQRDDHVAAAGGSALAAARVRAQVAGTVDEVLATVGHALGPAPLAYDEEHARRVADLTLYVRQHHADRDLARLGELVAPSPA